MIAFGNPRFQKIWWQAAPCLLGSGLRLRRGLAMNKNINYIGMVNLLRHFQTAGLVSQREARKIAARLRAETGAEVIFSP